MTAHALVPVQEDRTGNGSGGVRRLDPRLRSGVQPMSDLCEVAGHNGWIGTGPRDPDGESTEDDYSSLVEFEQALHDAIVNSVYEDRDEDDDDA